MHASLRVVPAVAAALLAVTLTACTGAADPAAGPATSAPAGAATPTVAGTPAATDGATPDLASTAPTGGATAPTDESSPAAPAALTQPPSVEGAREVARYFMELYPYVLRTGDVAPWSSLADPDCTLCRAVADGAADPDPKSKQAVDIRKVTAEKHGAGRYSVTVDLYETPKISSGLVHFAVAVSLVHDGTSWHVTLVDPVKKGK